MKKIRIGTCIPGKSFNEWAPLLKDKGFERFAINFHMSFSGVDLDRLAEQAGEILGGSDIKISALGYYCNALESDEQRADLARCIDKAHLFGTRVVSTFAGGLSGRPVDEAMPVFRQVFGELSRRAEDRGVTLAFENCPMGGTWQSVTCNIAFNARAWEMMFQEVPSRAIGLEWEPAHQLCQLVEPLANLRTWVDRVVHLHGKDATVKEDVIAREGIISSVPFVDSRFPGFGQTDWRQVMAILQEHGYDGTISIEGYHDPFYKQAWEMTGQLHALNYLHWCRGGSFTPNPWD